MKIKMSHSSIILSLTLPVSPSESVPLIFHPIDWHLILSCPFYSENICIFLRNVSLSIDMITNDITEVEVIVVE